MKPFYRHMSAVFVPLWKLRKLQFAPWKQRAALLALIALAGVGCTTGPMDINETYYLREVNGKSTNYYRVHIQGSTKLGVAEFRQGWHSAEAVDALFGDVSQDGVARALTTRQELRSQLDAAMIEARKNYLELAKNPVTPAKDLQASLEAIRRIRLSPRDVDTTFGARDVQWVAYNPFEDLVTPHAGQKLVLLLSSNPDDIIGKLADLSEDTKTEQVFNKLTDVVAKQTQKAQAAKEPKAVSDADVATAQTRQQIIDQATAQLVTQIDSTIKNLGAAPTVEQALGEIDAISSILRSFPDEK